MISETTSQNSREWMSRPHPPTDLSGLIFKACESRAEFSEVLKCRWRGYKKYGFASPESCRDGFDEKAVHYLSKNCATGEVVGCLRMLSKLNGKLELEDFTSISDWAVDGIYPAELTRFSVPAITRSSAIKFGLWKLAWIDAVKLGHTHFVIWTRKEAQRNYKMLGFEVFFGRKEKFCHPLLGGYWHSVMILDIIRAKNEYRENRPELYRFFSETHSEIILPRRTGRCSR